MTDPAWFAALRPEERGTPPGSAENHMHAGKWAAAWRDGRFLPGVPVPVSVPVEAQMGETLTDLRNRVPAPPAWLGRILSTWPGPRIAETACVCGDPSGEPPANLDDALLGMVEPLVEAAR
jgi:hypothetical protein